MARRYRRGSLNWTSLTIRNRHCRLRATSVLQLHAQGDTTMPVSQLSTSPPTRAGSAQLPLAELRMDDRPFLSLPAHSLGPPRPARAFTRQFSHVLSFMLLPCLQSPVSCAKGRLPPLGDRIRMLSLRCLLSPTDSVEVVAGSVESCFVVSIL